MDFRRGDQLGDDGADPRRQVSIHILSVSIHVC